MAQQRVTNRDKPKRASDEYSPNAVTYQREQDEPMGEQEKHRQTQLQDDLLALKYKDATPDGKVDRNSCFIEEKVEE